jgi:hypothetical protein
MSSRIRDIKLFAAKGTYDFYRRLSFAERGADAPGMGLLCVGNSNGSSLRNVADGGQE